MSNIHRILHEDLAGLEPAFPVKDILTLRENIPLLSRYSDFEIYTLYAAFSEECFCASWMVFPNYIEQFQFWLDS